MVDLNTAAVKFHPRSAISVTFKITIFSPPLFKSWYARNQLLCERYALCCLRSTQIEYDYRWYCDIVEHFFLGVDSEIASQF